MSGIEFGVVVSIVAFTSLGFMAGNSYGFGRRMREEREERERQRLLDVELSVKAIERRLVQ